MYKRNKLLIMKNYNKNIVQENLLLNLFYKKVIINSVREFNYKHQLATYKIVNLYPIFNNKL